LSRGDVFDADLGEVGRHPVVVVTRDIAIPVLTSLTVVLVTSTIRGAPAEVELGKDEGLDHECVANCDNIFTISKSRLVRRRGWLGLERLQKLDTALRLALGLD
jgi:mRNA interferase MazF